MGIHDRYTNDQNRASGRTTMAAMNIVHLVLDNPGEWIFIDDHAPVAAGDHMLFCLVDDVLKALRVRYQAEKRRLCFMCSGPPQTYTYPTADECFEIDEVRLKDDRRRGIPPRIIA